MISEANPKLHALRSALCAVLLLFPLAAYAYELVGEGCSKDRRKAVEYALSDLSSQIEVQVTSEFTSVQRGGGAAGGEAYMAHRLKTLTNLPIYAYTVSYDKGCAYARFDMSKAPMAYAARARELTEAIDNLSKQLPLKQAEQEERLKQALTLYGEYEPVARVCAFLGAAPPAPALSRYETEARLASLKAVQGDIEAAAKAILAAFKERPLYITPPALLGEQALTPFGAALAKLLSPAGTAASGSKYRLSCFYDHRGKGENFILSCEVRDRAELSLNASVFTLSKRVCEEAGCDALAASKRLAELSAGYASEGGLKGYFYTDLGSDEIYLRGGDLLRLYARVYGNASVAVLLVNDEGVYNIPLERREIVFGEETELVRLKVIPPYGEEYLILAAAKEFDINKAFEIAEKADAKEVFALLERELKRSQGGYLLKRVRVYTSP